VSVKLLGIWVLHIDHLEAFWAMRCEEVQDL